MIMRLRAWSDRRAQLKDEVANLRAAFPASAGKLVLVLPRLACLDSVSCAPYNAVPAMKLTARPTVVLVLSRKIS